jgi:hypothetical protein
MPGNVAMPEAVETDPVQILLSVCFGLASGLLRLYAAKTAAPKLGSGCWFSGFWCKFVKCMYLFGREAL